MKPIAAEPRLKPLNMMVINSERRRCGTYSESSVVAFGIAAPMPMPASRRSSAISCGEDDPAAMTVKMPNRNTAVVSTILRPNRSDKGPAISAPMTRPKGAALMTKPKAGREMFQSCRIEGVTKPMIATSIPSATTMRKHMATSAHRKGAIGRSSMKALMSIILGLLRS